MLKLALQSLWARRLTAGLTLLAVARTGRYTAAADLLGINHTTASRRVAALEQALGGPLLARGAAGWELTELGRSGVAAAERIAAAG